MRWLSVSARRVSKKKQRPGRLRHTEGSLLREKETGKTDDLTVARLRKAGAIILGKTNEPEFGHKGVTEK